MKTPTVLLPAVWQWCVGAESYTKFPLPTNGTYGVDVRTVELVDHNRVDPYDPNGGARKLMLSALYPTGPANQCVPKAYQYVPDATDHFFDDTLRDWGLSNDAASIKTLALTVCPPKQLEKCTSKDSSHDTRPEFPIVFFSHGLGASRLLSTAQAQSVAAQGYIVLAIDHPYDALVIKYLDGSLVYGDGVNTSSFEAVDNAVRVRAKDVSFVIDQLQTRSPLREIPPLCGKSAAKHVAMYGHSFGGATAAVAAYHDHRVMGVLNLDGAPYGFHSDDSGFNIPKGMRVPFLLFNAKEHANDSAFDMMYDAYAGYKKRLALLGSTHITFTDIPLIADLLHARTLNSSDYLGTISGLRARDSVAAYVGAFMDKVLKGKMPVLLDAPSPKYPEVVFV